MAIKRLSVYDQALSACTNCGLCTERASVMFCKQPGLKALSEKGLEYLERNETETYWNENSDLLDTLRSCSMCNFCTSSCPQGLKCSEVMVKWRCLLNRTGYTNADAAKSVLVDQEWHIFSVFRAVYDINYADLPILSSESGNSIDTVFFPGCTLASYGEELVRKTCATIAQQYPNYALDLNCCGSPLVSAGFAKRAANWRQQLVQRWADCGIKQVIFVCAGCQEELIELLSENGISPLPLPQVLLEASDKPAQTESGQVNQRQMVIFDSCHDRAGHHSQPLKMLLDKESVQTVSLAHSGKDTLCCGAGGTVATYSPELCQKRLNNIQSEIIATGHTDAVVSCLTCAYTFAYNKLLSKSDQTTQLTPTPLNCHHYLEVYYGKQIDWAETFNKLEAMWTGENAQWVAQQLS